MGKTEQTRALMEMVKPSVNEIRLVPAQQKSVDVAINTAIKTLDANVGEFNELVRYVNKSALLSSEPILKSSVIETATQSNKAMTGYITSLEKCATLCKQGKLTQALSEVSKLNTLRFYVDYKQKDVNNILEMISYRTRMSTQKSIQAVYDSIENAITNSETI